MYSGCKMLKRQNNTRVLYQDTQQKGIVMQLNACTKQSCVYDKKNEY